MNKRNVWKWLILIALVASSLAILSGGIPLGIDLQGGVSFTVEVDKPKLKRSIEAENPKLTEGELNTKVKEEASRAKDNALEVIRNRVDRLGIAEPIIYAASNEEEERIIVQLPGLSDEDKRAARDTILSVAFLEFRLVHKENEAWVKELIDNRTAPPGYKLLEGAETYVVDSEYEGKRDEDYYMMLDKWEYRPNSEFKLEKTEDRNGFISYRPVYVETRRQLTGDALDVANVDYHPVTRAPYISLTFDDEGAEQFAEVTRRYAPRGESNLDSDEGRRLGVVLDGTLYSSPTLNEEIVGGRAQITGSFTASEAFRLVNALNSGSLEVPVKIVQERNVSATLGKDSINSGLMALIIGSVVVLVFMVIYYMLSGIIANLALVLDILLLPLGMMIAAGFLGLLTGAAGAGSAELRLPTLTLPGIAGIVLTIGMAVDANVLIFERIREEQRAGKQFVNAVNAGYDKVFSTIFDANVTTLLVAIILFWQGSGPIRGFAITLSAGIIVSMYTALVVTRMFYDGLAAKSSIKKLKMLSIVKDPKVNFVGKRKIAAVLSLIVIVGSWVVFIQKGEENYGVDFLGGDALSINFNHDARPELQDLRSTLDGAGLEGAQIQYNSAIGAEAGHHTFSEFLDLKVPFGTGTNALSALQQSFPASKFSVLSQDSVGPQVGDELRKQGILAMIFAMIGIIIYISIRFEFAFAMGAIVAVVHDVLFTIGIFCLLGNQLSLPVIAALLTIVGYSVNDTIVVFDRIREDLNLIKGKSYIQIANLSINQTLSRTLLTSLTTLLTVVMLLVFGGGAIESFALTLLIGIIVGTYSSIFIATPVMLLWHREKKEEAKA